MTVYNMPPDTREKEKIVGGILDLYHLVWIALGIILYGLQAFLLFGLLSYVCLVTGLVFVAWGFVFALKKKDDMPYSTYLRYKFKFNKKTWYYVNAGYHDELEFSGEENING